MKEKGMTLLEVIIAITILLIGIGFVLKSNATTFRYKNYQREYEQSLFFAAGQMEALLAHQQLAVEEEPFQEFKVSHGEERIISYPEEAEGAAGLELISVEVASVNTKRIDYPIRLYTLRVVSNDQSNTNNSDERKDSDKDNKDNDNKDNDNKDNDNKDNDNDSDKDKDKDEDKDKDKNDEDEDRDKDDDKDK